MFKKKDSSDQSAQKPAEKKRRWYHNLADAYKITRRTYKWVDWAMAAIVVLSLALGIVIGVLGHGNLILWIVTGIMIAVLGAMSLLSVLVRPAMYSQIEGNVGAVYAVLSEIKRGWIISDEPIAVTKEKDLVWRLVGRPGVVFVSEGPTSRVRHLLHAERKKVHRIVKNTPVTLLEVGNGEGQIPLAKLSKNLKRLKNVLTKEEVPSVAQRLSALRGGGVPIPKGVDPMKARPNRRAMRGK